MGLKSKCLNNKNGVIISKTVLYYLHDFCCFVFLLLNVLLSFEVYLVVAYLLAADIFSKLTFLRGKKNIPFNGLPVWIQNRPNVLSGLSSSKVFANVYTREAPRGVCAPLIPEKNALISPSPCK